MPEPGPHSQSMAWLTFAMITVVAWGLYGVLLHSGQVAMGDPAHGRYKAFLWVGIAYVLVAVLAPLLMLVIGRATWQMPARGISLSLMAGIVGAVGAFFVLVAFGTKGSPAVVMSIIFAGAPIVNAVVAMLVHPPASGWVPRHWPFLVGIILAAIGGCLVTLYRPPPARYAAPQQQPAVALSQKTTP